MYLAKSRLLLLFLSNVKLFCAFAEVGNTASYMGMKDDLSSPLLNFFKHNELLLGNTYRLC